MLKKVANESGTPRIGVVLSSGGVRGVYAHTGFMQAIQALGIPVSGNSVTNPGSGCGMSDARNTKITGDWIKRNA